MDAASSEKDTIQQFFDSIEILRWARKNQSAIDQLGKFIDHGGIKSIYLIQAFNELAENHRRLGDISNAIYYLDEVDNNFFNNPSLEKSELVRSNFYRGKVFRSKGSLDSARYFHHKALGLAEQYDINDDPVVGEIWMDLAFIESNHVEDVQQALIYNIIAQNNYLKTLDLNHIKLAYVFYELASNYRTIGDFERAVNYSRMAEIIYGFYANQFISLQVNCKVVQGTCYLDNGNYKKANDIYKHVIKSYANAVKPTRDALKITLFNNGVALLHLEEYEKARKSIEQSIEINPLQYDTDSADLVYAYSNLALILEDLKQFDKANYFLNKCISISISLFGKKHIEVFEGYRYLGMHFEKRGYLKKALVFYQKALIAGFVNFDETNIYINPLPFDSIPKNAAFNILFDKARAFKKKFDIDKIKDDLLAAFDLYKIAYGLIREAANSDFMEESLLNIPQTFKDELNYGIACALALYESTNDPLYLDYLFQFVETNKYFLLQNSVAKSKSRETLGIPDSAYQKEKVLLEQINTLKQEINKAQFADTEKEYNKRLELLNTTVEWEKVRKQWDTSEKTNITFSELSSTISLDNIRNQLIGENDILLEYFQTADTLYTIVICKERERIIRLPKNQELETNQGIYLNHIFNKDIPAGLSNFKEFVHASHDLYKKLIQPALSSVGVNTEVSNQARLIIIPDGQLSVLPFESLIQQPADTAYMNYYGLNYLCRDFIINYAYSVNILKDNLVAEEDKNSKILAFSYSSANKEEESSTRNDEYGELPYSAVELRNINKWIKDGVFLDGDLATESNFKSKSQDHEIIHLALHGVGDTEDMLNSSIIFKGSGNETEDGKLYAHELYGIDLSGTKLAVLSACETGIGKTMQGEGVYSLARGFAYAGCPAIVMSLWKVSDETSADIMDYFYKYLAKGVPKDVALQKAKIDFLDKSNDLTAHPANWAAFIALGDNEPIHIEQSLMRWYYWITLFVIIGASLMIYRNIRSRKIDAE